MVSILSIIGENLPTKSSKTWTLFEITLHHMFSRPERYNSEHQLTKQHGKSNDIICQYPLGRDEHGQTLKYSQIKIHLK